MKRKVIQIADSTLLVSLPKKWADKQNIKKGDEVDVDPKGSKLLISLDKEPHSEKISIRLDDSTKFLRRSIDALYRYGYDEIEVNFKDYKIVSLVQECLEELMGYEIVGQTPASCTIRDITFGREVEFDSILRRVFFMINELGRDLHDALSANKRERIDELKQFDTMVNKFTNFCERLLNKKGHKDYKKTTLIYYVVCALEEIADEYKDICDYISDKKSYKPSKETLLIHKQINEHFKDFLDLYYKFSYEGLYRLKQNMNKINNSIRLQLESPSKGEHTIVLHHFATILGQIRHMSSRIV